MSHIIRTGTEHITTPLADEDNYAYCQSRGAHNIKHIFTSQKKEELQRVVFEVQRHTEHYIKFHNDG